MKSKEGFNIAWVEEAATVSEASFDMLRNTIRRPGSEIWLTWNPRFETDPIDRIFRGADAPPRSAIRRVNWVSWSAAWSDCFALGLLEDRVLTLPVVLCIRRST